MTRQTRQHCTNPMRRTHRRSGKSSPATYLRRHTVPANNLFADLLEPSTGGGIPDPDAVHDGLADEVERRRARRFEPTGDPRIWVNCVPEEILTERGLTVPNRRGGVIVVNTAGRGLETDILDRPDHKWRAWARSGREVHVVVWDLDDDGTPVFPELDRLLDLGVDVTVHGAFAMSGGHATMWTDVSTDEPLFTRRTDLEQRVRDLSKKDRAKATAARKRAAEVARSIDVPEFRTAAEGFTGNAEAALQAVESLLDEDGRGLLAAGYKAGKTTLVNNLCASLADGTPFLGQFATQPRRVMLLDTELTDTEAAKRLDALPIHNRANVARIGLEGRAGSFDIRVPAVRAAWAKRLREFGTEVLILDCLAPVLEALGVDENRKASSILYALSTLKRDAGVSEVIVVHHTGHDGKRPRGDSGVPAWASSIWTLTATSPRPDAPRRFSATGWTGIGVPEGRLVHDADTGALTYVDTDPDRAERVAKAAETASAGLVSARAMLVDILTAANAEMSKSRLETAAKDAGIKPRALVREAVESLVDDQTFTARKKGNTDLIGLARDLAK